MSYNSPFEAIEQSTLARLPLIAGAGLVSTSNKVVPPWLMFKPLQSGGEALILKPETLPGGYPGAVVSLDEDHVRIIGEPEQTWDNANVVYEVPVTIIVYATSDGTVAYAARNEALRIALLVHSDLLLFTPSGFPANCAPTGPLIPREWNTVPVDASTHGLCLDFAARYQIAVSTSSN